MVRRDKNQWLKLFKKHEKSGLTITEFCFNEGVNNKYFSLRRKQLGYKVASTKSTNDFIKVSVSKPTHGFSLEYGDLKLSWDELPPVAWLSDFLKTLR
jgi:hypothetical protein